MCFICKMVVIDKNIHIDCNHLLIERYRLFLDQGSSVVSGAGGKVRIVIAIADLKSLAANA